MENKFYDFKPIYHFIKSMALEQKFWPDIDKLFRDLRPGSLTAARKHRDDGGFIISALPHRERLRAVELLGIYSADPDACNNLIEKICRHELEYIYKHKDNLDFMQFMQHFAKKNKGTGNIRYPYRYFAAHATSSSTHAASHPLRWDLMRKRVRFSSAAYASKDLLTVANKSLCF